MRTINIFFKEKLRETQVTWSHISVPEFHAKKYQNLNQMSRKFLVLSIARYMRKMPSLKSSTGRNYSNASHMSHF